MRGVSEAAIKRCPYFSRTHATSRDTDKNSVKIYCRKVGSSLSLEFAGVVRNNTDKYWFFITHLCPLLIKQKSGVHLCENRDKNTRGA
jgi:hypothetical protein